MALSVRFQGEQVLGQAGPYRAFFTNLGVELQQITPDADSYPLRLLVPTPNQRASIGDNRHKYIPNPTFKAPHYLDLFEFFGVLMGRFPLLFQAKR